MSAAVQCAMFGLPDFDATAPRAIFQCTRKSQHANNRPRTFTRTIAESGTAASCPECNRTTYGQRINGHYSPAPCADACRFAEGPNCDCSCSGANHGRGW